MERASITQILLLTIICLTVFFAQSLYGQNRPDGFEGSKAWNKLDPGLQKAWLDAKKAGDMGHRLDCFVRVRAPADEGDRSFLENHGYVVRQFAGTIATGHMKAGDLQSVAELPFVDSVRLAAPPGQR